MPLFYHILSIPAKLLTCLNADTPQRVGHLGGIGQVFNPADELHSAIHHATMLELA
jgi:hypothetical protein